MRSRPPLPMLAWLCAPLAAGCDPIINIQGAFFPAWILCLAGGIALTAVAHRLFVSTGLQGYLGPLALVYPSLALLFTMALWLAFFRT